MQLVVKILGRLCDTRRFDIRRDSELVFSGTRDGDTVSVAGAVSQGDHVTATVTLREAQHGPLQ